MFLVNKKFKILKNLMRGVNDYAIRQCNSLLCAIPGLNHSQEDFYEKHLMSRKGEGIESSFYYWTGNAVGVLAELATLKGGPTAINIGRLAVQKVGLAAGRAGIQAAVHAKLTTGSIGKGVAQHLPRAAGGGALAIHESATFASQFSKLVALKSVETVVKVLKNSSELLRKAPEIAKYIQKPVVDSQEFLRGLRNMVKSPLTSHIIEDITVKNSISSEIDSIANQAISKASKDINEAEAVFEDFEGVLDSLDDRASSFQKYLEFVHRHQMRKFVQNMNCPKEAISYVMEKVPERTSYRENITEETVKNILKAQDNIEYCNKHVRDPWVRDKLMQLLWSEGKFSVFGSDIKGYSEQFKTIVEQYGLDMSKHWNQLRIPRHAVISKNFHNWVLEELQDIHQKIQQMEISDDVQRRSSFLQQFNIRIKNTLKSNPLISHPKWYKFWKNDKSHFENSQEFVQVVGGSHINSNAPQYSESSQQVSKSVSTDKTTYKIHKDLQFRHFEEGGAIDDKKSLVYWNYEKIILKTEPLIGKGISVDEKKFGEKDFKEVVGFDEICGEVYDQDTLQWIKTKFAKIHYRLDGRYHIVPIKPTSSHAKQWENLHGKS
ncbi:MAG: hypothetical protein S4CHLAM6_09830 [Chlamydiae bacterium]|nr:hypothetical protein [Chlamydiota bacterium]